MKIFQYFLINVKINYISDIPFEAKLKPILEMLWQTFLIILVVSASLSQMPPSKH